MRRSRRERGPCPTTGGEHPDPMPPRRGEGRPGSLPWPPRVPMSPTRRLRPPSAGGKARCGVGVGLAASGAGMAAGKKGVEERAGGPAGPGPEWHPPPAGPLRPQGSPRLWARRWWIRRRSLVQGKVIRDPLRGWGSGFERRAPCGRPSTRARLLVQLSSLLPAGSPSGKVGAEAQSGPGHGGFPRFGGPDPWYRYPSVSSRGSCGLPVPLWAPWDSRLPGGQKGAREPAEYRQPAPRSPTPRGPGESGLNRPAAPIVQRSAGCLGEDPLHGARGQGRGAVGRSWSSEATALALRLEPPATSASKPPKRGGAGRPTMRPGPDRPKEGQISPLRRAGEGAEVPTLLGTHVLGVLRTSPVLIPAPSQGSPGVSGGSASVTSPPSSTRMVPGLTFPCTRLRGGAWYPASARPTCLRMDSTWGIGRGPRSRRSRSREVPPVPGAGPRSSRRTWLPQRLQKRASVGSLRKQEGHVWEMVGMVDLGSGGRLSRQPTGRFRIPGHVTATLDRMSGGDRLPVHQARLPTLGSTANCVPGPGRPRTVCGEDPGV